ncbi:MAG: hypothetical protein ACI4MP_11765 [Candidatus Ventricola sp.]
MEERNEEMLRAPLDAQEITGELMEENAERAAQEDEELAASLREGVGLLFEDGWTGEELAALSQDEGVRSDVAAGIDLIRAAARMLRRQLLEMRAMQASRRRGVPVTRSSAAGAAMPDNRIDAMSDAQFDEFSRQARAAAMMGKKVRM